MRANVVGTAVIILLSLAYWLPQYLSHAGYLAALICIVGVILLRHWCILLMPVIIFTPIQAHAGLPLFFFTTLSCVGFSLLRRPSISRNEWGTLVACGLVLAWATFSFARAEDISLATGYYTPYLKGALVVLMIVLIRREKQLLQALLRTIASVSGCAVVIKLLYMINFDAIDPLLTLDLPSVSGRADIYVSGANVRRLVLVDQDPNYAAALQLIGLAASLHLATIKDGGARHGWWTLCAASNFLQILGTYSRSGFIVACIILLFSIRPSVRSIAALTIGLGLSVAYVASNQALADRISSIFNDQTGGTGRMGFWSDGAGMWANNIWFGEGLSDYTHEVGDAAHSTYLQALAEQGLVGFVFLVASMVSVTNIKQSVHNAQNNVCLAAVGAFALMLQTITFFDIDVLWMALFFLALPSNAYAGVRT